MGIFSAIKDFIFHKKAEAAPVAEAAAPVAVPSAAAAAPVAPVTPPPLTAAEIEAVLQKAADSFGQPLNWRTSIVDLMKLVGLDPSHENRVTLAKELGYTGDFNDSAAMNIWLHKQVLAKLAADGGDVPDELK